MSEHVPRPHLEREHIRRGLIHIALILVSIDTLGAVYLAHIILSVDFYSDCGKVGTIIGTIACYLE